MRLALTLVCAALISAGPAHAADRADRVEIISRIRDAVDACNRNDVTAFTRYLRPSPIVLDEVPPCPFRGSHQALADWEASYDAESKQNVVSDPLITLLTVKDVDITGTRAFIVWPAAYGYKQAGKASVRYSTITFAMEKTGRDWRIAAWLWSKE